MVAAHAFESIDGRLAEPRIVEYCILLYVDKVKW